MLQTNPKSPGGSICPVCDRQWNAAALIGDAGVQVGQPCPAQECDSHHEKLCNDRATDEHDSTCLCSGVAPTTTRDEKPLPV